MELHDMRKEFSNQLDDQLELPENPFKAFKYWFGEAKKLYKEDANCFVLSSSDKTKNVSSRVVLLKSFDDKSLTFFTNYNSRKASDIEETPKVSCLFYWSSMEKQIRIEATAKKLSAKESEAYFSSRPRNSQISAWASRQSEEIPSKRSLIDKFLEYKKQFSGKENIPCPDFWGGYELVPYRFEFWQGGLYRLHDRLLYTKKGKSSAWSQTRLSP